MHLTGYSEAIAISGVKRFLLDVMEEFKGTNLSNTAGTRNSRATVHVLRERIPANNKYVTTTAEAATRREKMQVSPRIWDTQVENLFDDIAYHKKPCNLRPLRNESFPLELTSLKQQFPRRRSYCDAMKAEEEERKESIQIWRGNDARKSSYHSFFFFFDFTR